MPTLGGQLSIDSGDGSPEADDLGAGQEPFGIGGNVAGWQRWLRPDGGAVASPLRAPLSPDQETLLRVVSEPFLATGEWPVWQYADLTLDDQHGLDAAAVLASLPEAGDRSPSSQAYGLVWRPDSYRQPQPDDHVTITVAGLWHMSNVGPLAGAFLAMICHLVDRQRQVVPSPMRWSPLQ